MTQDELIAALAASPSPDRITPEYLASRITKVDYARIMGTLTLCVITLDNGFTVTGESACADPANYREQVGRKIAYDMAERKIWPLLGFALKEAMAARDATKPSPAPAVIAEEGWSPFTSRKAVDCAVIRAAEFDHEGGGRVVIRKAGGGPEVVQVPAGFSRMSGSVREGDILVRYSDGYLSHIPRAKFEEPGVYVPRWNVEYREPDFRDRVRAEAADLADRLEKLRAFLGTGKKPDNLAWDEFRRMQQQRACMVAYLGVLNARIAAFPA